MMCMSDKNKNTGCIKFWVLLVNTNLVEIWNNFKVTKYEINSTKAKIYPFWIFMRKYLECHYNCNITLTNQICVIYYIWV